MIIPLNRVFMILDLFNRVCFICILLSRKGVHELIGDQFSQTRDRLGGGGVVSSFLQNRVESGFIVSSWSHVI